MAAEAASQENAWTTPVIRNAQPGHNNDNDTSYPSVNLFWHDRVAVDAAQAGLIDTTKYNRTTVRNALATFFAAEMAARSASSESASSSSLSSELYPLQCPTAAQLDELWQTSLELERACLGTSWANHLEQETRAAFDIDIADRSFCFVNTTAVLMNTSLSPIRSFLVNHFGPSVAAA